MIVIRNPRAGNIRRLPAMLAAISATGRTVTVLETARAGDATELARDAARRASLVVAAGGDGTVAEVAAGLAGTAAATALGILPVGSANVLARELGLPFAPAALAAVLAADRRRPLWPGLASVAGGAPRLFLQMAGVGLDAAVVHNLPHGLKRRLGRGAYLWQFGRELARRRPAAFAVRLDGRSHDASAVVVTKGRFYAGPYLLAPDADPHAPGFRVALFHPPGRLPALAAAAALPLGLLPRLPGLSLLRAERVEVGSAGLSVQCDGDAAGQAPLSIRDAAAPLFVAAP